MMSTPNMEPAVGGSQLDRSSQGDEPTQLEFTQAMKDFKNMFPMLEDEVIEAVLRANNGVVDSTIDQLLTMTVDCEGEKQPLPSAMQDGIPAQPLYPEEAPQVHSMNDLPSYNDVMSGSYRGGTPPKYSLPVDDYKPQKLSAEPKTYAPSLPASQNTSNSNSLYTPSLLDSDDISLASSVNTHDSPEYAVPKKKRKWKPPLVGKLPDDFLRLSVTDTYQIHGAASMDGSPRQSHSNISPRRQESLHSTSANSSRQGSPGRTSGARPKGSPSVVSPRRRTEPELNSKILMQKMAENKQRRLSMPSEGEEQQMLEDEYLALMLQNEEFLHELRQDPDFMMTLHRDQMKAGHNGAGDSPERRLLGAGDSPERRHSHHFRRAGVPSPERKLTHQASLPARPLRRSSPSSPRRKSSSSSNSTPTHQPLPDPPVVTKPASWAKWELPEPPRIRMCQAEDEQPIIVDRTYCPEGEEAQNGQLDEAGMDRPPEDQIIGYGDDHFHEMGAFPYSRGLYGEDNAAFKDQLKYMGKTSRKKFVAAAKRFFSRGRKKPPRQLLRDSNAPSQLNLLEGEEYEHSRFGSKHHSADGYTSFQ